MNSGPDRAQVLRPGPWFTAFGLLTGLLVLVPQLADPVLTRGWALLAALAVGSGLLRTVDAVGARRVRSGARRPSHDDPVAATLPARPEPTRSGPAGRVLRRLAVVLPPGERPLWRAELAAVLAYTEGATEKRRQAFGFALALPATALCCWRLRAGRRR